MRLLGRRFDPVTWPRLTYGNPKASSEGGIVAAKTTLVVLLVCAALGLGACGPDGPPPASGGGEEAAAPGAREQGRTAPQERTGARGTAAERTREQEPRPEETRSELEELLDEPARAPEPAYATVGDGTGALSLQVPAAWGEVIVGQESEGRGSWTTFGGAGVASSITAAPGVAAWHGAVGAVATYAAAPRA